MVTKKQILTALWILIALIALAATACYIFMPKYKGMFLLGCGGFLILNLLLSMYFIKSNYKDKP